MKADGCDYYTFQTHNVRTKWGDIFTRSCRCVRCVDLTVVRADAIQKLNDKTKESLEGLVNSFIELGKSEITDLKSEQIQKLKEELKKEILDELKK